MILKELLERSEYTLVQGSEDVEISTLVYDSRKIEKRQCICMYQRSSL